MTMRSCEIVDSLLQQSAAGVSLAFSQDRRGEPRRLFALLRPARGGGMRIKNWRQFQHFNDRNPIWIKLYRRLLDDLEWHELDPTAAKVLVGLWLLASETHGDLPDEKVIAFRLRTTENSIKTAISKLGHWLDNNTISTCYQDDILETERETERETEKEREYARTPSNARFQKPTLAEVAAYCAERNNGIDAQAFIDKHEANGWKVGRNPMKDWRATVRTWERYQSARTKPRDRMAEIVADLTAEHRATRDRQ